MKTIKKNPAGISDSFRLTREAVYFFYKLYRKLFKLIMILCFPMIVFPPAFLNSFSICFQPRFDDRT